MNWITSILGFFTGKSFVFNSQEKADLAMLSMICRYTANMQRDIATLKVDVATLKASTNGRN